MNNRKQGFQKSPVWGAVVSDHKIIFLKDRTCWILKWEEGDASMARRFWRYLRSVDYKIGPNGSDCRLHLRPVEESDLNDRVGLFNALQLCGVRENNITLL